MDARARRRAHRHRADEIAALAREYATTRPAAIRLNYGVQRSERGAMAVRTIALLPALTGSWKDVGGGLQLSISQAFQLNRAGLERADLQEKARWAARRASSTCRCWARRSTR
jgi:anaerobic selenocysteine-containing dehydrogenase